MGRSFNLLIFCLMLLFFATAVEASDDTPQQSAEALDSVALRMKSLSQSLNGLPQPPAFDQKIQLPNALISLAPQASKTKENDLEKENAE